MRARDFITELWTQPYELTSRATGPANREYEFKTKDDRPGRIVFDSFLDTDQGGTHVVLVLVHFYIDNDFHTSGKGDAIAIFSTVVAACRDYLRRYRPPVVAFESDDAKKLNLYAKMAGMFPDYVIYPYPQWGRDPVVGDEIFDSLMDANPKAAVVLHRRDYVPGKTRLYVDEQGAAEGFPQPGESSGKAKQFNPNAKVQTREMTLDQILNSVKGIPYVNNVVDDWDAKDYSWGVTKKVIEYAHYLQKNPQSVANLPPLVVIDGQLNDGAHRLSAINLLQKRMDPKNPLWKQVKLKVNFGTSADVASEQGVAENFGGRKFVKPNFDFEWEEAERYPEFVRLGKDAWIKLARKGRAVVITSAQGINNTDAADPDSFKSLDPEKQKRALAQLETGTVEMPIVAVYNDGRKELVGGNTRLTAMMARDGQATVWAFRVPGEQGIAEGTRQQLDFDSLYGKVFKITDNNGNPNNPGFSIVTPLNGESWNWRERPEFKKIVKQKLNDPAFLGDHKYQQIIDAMSGNKFDSSKHVVKDVAENFADGKVKGRSRPGRVKRAGASCSGSVTDLRQRAKNASGERAKMYHWCANMKSGRKNESEDFLEDTRQVVSNLMIGDYHIAVDKHLFDREQDRSINRENILSAINKITGAKAKIKQLAAGQGFWLHDNTTDISVGIRIIDLDQRKFLAKTVLHGRSFTDRYPTFEVR